MSNDIILIAFVIFFIVQIVVLSRIVVIIRRFTKILFEVRIIFKHAGLSYDSRKKTVVQNNICQHCKYRMPFIEMIGDSSLDNFYYKCKKRDIEIELSDTCEYFERDYQLK